MLSISFETNCHKNEVFFYRILETVTSISTHHNITGISTEFSTLPNLSLNDI